MKDTTKVLFAVEKSFLEKVDNHWHLLGFKNRTEYISFLMRNDVNKQKAV